MNINIQDLKKKIIYRSAYRGSKEMDSLLGSFSKKYQGTGLGLAMVKRLTELHRGYVDVQSELGKGSCFTVWLPIENSSFTVKDSMEGFLHDKKKVLIVNHGDNDAAIMRTILEGANIEVYRCSAVSELTELVEKYQIDAVLAEVAGQELSQLQTHPCFSHPKKSIPLILIQTGSVDLAGVAIKPSGIVNKPISKNSLLRSVIAAGIPVDKPLEKDYTVLVVDDDPHSVHLITTFLQHDKIAIKKAYSGDQAIASLGKSEPDLVILDLMMPRVTGFDVVAYMQAHNLHHIPIVVVTAKIITEGDLQKLSGKVSDIIEKFNIDQQGFVGYIESLLGKTDAR